MKALGSIPTKDQKRGGGEAERPSHTERIALEPTAFLSPEAAGYSSGNTFLENIKTPN